MKVMIFFYLKLLHLTYCLRSVDICIQKQTECKGFYDKQHKYETKCTEIKCNGKFKNKCGSNNVCAKSEFICNEYNQLNNYYFSINKYKTVPFFRLDRSMRDRKNAEKVESFKKNIKNCENKIYEIKSTDYCINGLGCVLKSKVLKGFGYNYKIKKTDCKCSIEMSFKCEKYCAIDSNACNHILNSNDYKKKISDCGNHNQSYILSYSTLW
jgi:hypothetical protein